jgi:hypothetical protein
MTWAALGALWDERDRRYRSRQQFRSHLPLPLSPEEAKSVRDYRRTEIESLPAHQRPAALIEVLRWYPPSAL